VRIATIMMFLVAVAGPASAGSKAGVTMPDRIEVGGKPLVLNGMGLREATWLKVDVYVAGLYLESVSSDAGAIIAQQQTKRLVLRFVRDVDRSDIVKAWTGGFKGNATVKLDAIQPLIERLNGWMGDFEKGDTLVFTFVPGTGVEVVVNGTRKGVLAGEDFGRSLLAIWLGPKPPTGALKKGLLGNHGGAR
jgi:chalcone isomerase-like protein